MNEAQFKETHEMVERTTILRAVIGSTVHGLNVRDGLEDRDEMGVCIEDIEYVAGLKTFEQYIFRTAAVREGKHDAKSRAGDLDLVIYSLRKYVRLALQGNPTVLNLLFTKGEHIVKADARGTTLQQMAPQIVSKQAAGRFMGYLVAQKQRLLGERGGKDVRRPELEQAFGFDTKYAMHMLRLGYQGIELLETGKITLPMKDGIRSYLWDVRVGKVSLNNCLTRVGELEVMLRDAEATSPLSEHPDTAAVEKWMVSMYLENWKARDTSWLKSELPAFDVAGYAGQRED